MTRLDEIKKHAEKGFYIHHDLYYLLDKVEKQAQTLREIKTSLEERIDGSTESRGTDTYLSELIEKAESALEGK